MKLTKQARKELESVLHALKRAEEYLMRPDVAGIAHKTDWPNGASYTIQNPACAIDGTASVNVMDKHVGSNITGLYNGLRMLERLLNETEKPKKEREDYEKKL